MQVGSKVYVYLEKKLVAEGYIEALNDDIYVECHGTACEKGWAIVQRFTVYEKFKDVDLPRKSPPELVKVENLKNTRYLSFA